MPSGKARMPAITSTLGLINAYGRMLARSQARYRGDGENGGTGSRSGAATAIPIEPAPFYLWFVRAALAAAVEDRRDPAAGRTCRLWNRLLLREYLDEHVGKHVGVLDAGPVLRVGDEPAVLGRAEEHLVEPGAKTQQRGRVRDDSADGRHVRHVLLAREHPDPRVGEVDVLAPGRDREVGTAEEYGGGLARVVARDRERAQLVLEGRIAGLGVCDHADFPAVGDDHRDVTLGKRRVLLRLIARLVGARECVDEVLQLDEALLRAVGVEAALPLVARLGGDVPAEVPDERKRRVPVLAREVQGGEVRVGAVRGHQLLAHREQVVHARRNLDVGRREEVLA